MAITRAVNIITRQMNAFFPSTLLASSFGIFHFCISRPTKFSSMGSLPHLHSVLICKIHIYMSKITPGILLRQIFFLQKFANFCYVTCFVPNLILIRPRSHELSTLKKVLEHFLPSTSYLISLLRAWL